MAPTKAAPDVLIANEGTVFVFGLITPAAEQWVAENVVSEPWQRFGHSIVVEHRFAWGLAQGMRDVGLVLE